MAIYRDMEGHPYPSDIRRRPRSAKGAAPLLIHVLMNTDDSTVSGWCRIETQYLISLRWESMRAYPTVAFHS